MTLCTWSSLSQELTLLLRSHVFAFLMLDYSVKRNAANRHGVDQFSSWQRPRSASVRSYFRTGVV